VYLWNVGRQLIYNAVHPRRQFWTSGMLFGSKTYKVICLENSLEISAWGWRNIFWAVTLVSPQMKIKRREKDRWTKGRKKGTFENKMDCSPVMMTNSRRCVRPVSTARDWSSWVCWTGRQPALLPTS
jgi:hypothetical protein